MGVVAPARPPSLPNRLSDQAASLATPAGQAISWTIKVVSESCAKSICRARARTSSCSRGPSKPSSVSRGVGHRGIRRFACGEEPYPTTAWPHGSRRPALALGRRQTRRSCSVPQCLVSQASALGGPGQAAGSPAASAATCADRTGEQRCVQPGPERATGASRACRETAGPGSSSLPPSGCASWSAETRHEQNVVFEGVI
jgi:hypothetical protein